MRKTRNHGSGVRTTFSDTCPPALFTGNHSPYARWSVFLFLAIGSRSKTPNLRSLYSATLAVFSQRTYIPPAAGETDVIQVFINCRGITSAIAQHCLAVAQAETSLPGNGGSHPFLDVIDHFGVQIMAVIEADEVPLVMKKIQHLLDFSFLNVKIVCHKKSYGEGKGNRTSSLFFRQSQRI